MKIRVDKKGMRSLLSAMLLKSSVQEEFIMEALGAIEEIEDDSEDKDRAIHNAKKAIAALTNTELEECDDEGCSGHLSKEAVRLCREALEGNSMYDVGFVAGHQKCTEQLTGLDKARREEIGELRQKNEAQAVKMAAMRREIERMKEDAGGGERPMTAGVASLQTDILRLNDLYNSKVAEIERLKEAMVDAAGAYAEPAQPRSEPEAGVGTTQASEAPREAAEDVEASLLEHLARVLGVTTIEGNLPDRAIEFLLDLKDMPRDLVRNRMLVWWEAPLPPPPYPHPQHQHEAPGGAATEPWREIARKAYDACGPLEEGVVAALSRCAEEAYEAGLADRNRAVGDGKSASAIYEAGHMEGRHAAEKRFKDLLDEITEMAILHGGWTIEQCEARDCFKREILERMKD